MPRCTAGGCTSCYYGETSSPDAEGDAFVNGSLSGQLTIGTANDVIVDGNITYADCPALDDGPERLSAPSEGFCPYNPGGTNDYTRPDRQQLRRSQPTPVGLIPS